MKNLLRGVFFVVSLMLANSVLALGLGAAQVLSALGQPLKIEIPVVEVGNLTESDIRIQSAKQEGELSQGIPYQFQLLRNSENKLVVMATTKNSIAEPYVAFTLTLEVAGGLVSREYILMLDF